MLCVYLNEKACPIEPNQSLLDLLQHHNHLSQHFAVAINNQFVPRIAYSKTELVPGDRIDMIVPMQGG